MPTQPLQPEDQIARGVTGLLCSEMATTDIPAAGGINSDALKAGDDDSMEVVVRIPAGRNTRGWYYTPSAIQQIVAAVNEQALPGFLGHQEEHEIATKFPNPVTHWVGAIWNAEEQAAYFRGVIDQSAPRSQTVGASRRNQSGIDLRAKRHGVRLPE